MDIDKLTQIAVSSNPQPAKKRTKKNESRKASSLSFANVLRKSSEKEAMLSEVPGLRLVGLTGTETVEELLDEVMTTGETLKKSMLMEPLRNYKHAVARFLRHVLDNMVKIDNLEGIRNMNTMTQKKYSIIKIVDKKLEIWHHIFLRIKPVISKYWARLMKSMACLSI